MVVENETSHRRTTAGGDAGFSSILGTESKLKVDFQQPTSEHRTMTNYVTLKQYFIYFQLLWVWEKQQLLLHVPPFLQFNYFKLHSYLWYFSYSSLHSTKVKQANSSSPVPASMCRGRGSPTFPPGWTRGSGRRRGPARRWRCPSPLRCPHPSSCRPQTPRRLWSPTSRSGARPPAQWSQSRRWRTWARAFGRPGARWRSRWRWESYWGSEGLGTAARVTEELKKNKASEALWGISDLISFWKILAVFLSFQGSYTFFI